MENSLKTTLFFKCTMLMLVVVELTSGQGNVDGSALKPQEVGQPLTLDCDLVPGSYDNVEWHVTYPAESDQALLQAECFGNGTCNDLSNNINAEIDTQRDQSRLTIASLTLKDDGAVWHCLQGSAENGSLEVTKEFVVSVFDGPRNPVVEIYGLNSEGKVDVCPSSTTSGVVVTCKIDQSDAHPAPVFTLLRNGSVIQDNVLATLGGQVYSVVRSVDMTTGGIWTFTCVAKNSVMLSATAEVSKTVEVRVPPSSFPVVEAGSQIFTGDTDNSVVAREYFIMSHVACTIRGGYPKVTGIQLVCDGIEMANYEGNEVRVIGIQFIRYMDGYECQCVATHPTGCYDKRTAFNVSVAYGPSEVSLTSITVHNKTYEDTRTEIHYNKCPPGTSDPEVTSGIQVSCKVEGSTVNPAPDFQVLLNNSITTEATTGTLTSDGMYTYTTTMSPELAGRLEITCQSSNQLYPTFLTERDEATVYVREPPTAAPLVTIVRDGQFRSTADSGSVLQAREGERVDVRCEVRGGLPVVSSVTLTCGSKSETTSGTHTSFTFRQISLGHDNTLCECTASHITDCYTKSSKLTLKVGARTDSSDSDSDSDSTIMYVAVAGGVSIGLVLLVGLGLCAYYSCNRSRAGETSASRNRPQQFNGLA